VTGKRLAKSWRWEEANRAAIQFYRSLECECGQHFLHQQPALRLFLDEGERVEYQRRKQSILEGLVRDEVDISASWFHAPYGGFEMPEAARLDVPCYLDVSRLMFRGIGAFLSTRLLPARDLEVFRNGVRFPSLGVEVGTLVFCCGFSTEPDPWFGGIRFNAAKGEILTVRIPGLTEPRVVHRGVWLAPVSGDLYRCGATYTWDELNTEPTASGLAEIESRLRQFLKLPFEVVDQQAAVRPVIDAGFPVLGRHPVFPQLAYFNGLGSKGSLLAPLFADQFVSCLLGEREPDREVDLRRFLTLPLGEVNP
jgi:glycine/D-amino acid oxidase-like deaminating enzyme